MLQETLQAFLTLVALVNPAMCATIFRNSTGPLSKAQCAFYALKGTIVISIVLMISAMFGADILSVFGITLDAFSVAGGGILCFIGVKMMMAANSPTPVDVKHSDAHVVSLTPLIMFAASPGTITGVITISSSQSGATLPTILAALLVSILLLFILIASSYMPVKAGQPSLARQMITNYLGVIVIAMGVQFAFEGFKHFMF